jgi:hypothetical protein
VPPADAPRAPISAPRLRGAATAARLLGSTAFLGGLIGVITWRPPWITPTPGYDGSSATAVNWGTALGIDHGSDFVYTYGPLGLGDLALATFGSAPALYSAAYLAAANLGLGIVLLWAARRALPLAAAFGVALLVAVSVIDMLPAIAFVLAALALVDAKGTPRTVLGVAGPVLVGVGALAKLNEGAIVALLITIALVTLEWRHPRRLLASAGIFAVVFAVGWFATGQGVGNLDDYVIGTVEVVSGYSVGQVGENPEVPWDRWAAAAMVLAVLAATALLSRGLPRPRRVGLLALVLVYSFASAKHGFVRHDAPHMTSFIQAMLLPWLVLPWSGRARLVPALAIGTVTLVSIPILGSHIAEQRWDLPSRISTVDRLVTLVDPGERREAEEAARGRMQDAYRLPEAQQAILRGGDVHVEPQEASLLWAYGLDWHPLPTFDSFAAYAPAQDEDNAEALSGDDGPELILRYWDPAYKHPNYAINGRYGPWNTPAAALATLCHYRPLSTSRRFQILGRRSDRCGEPRTLGTVRATYGEPVRVPRAPGNGVLLARITGLEPTPLEALKRLLYRGDTRTITLDGTETYEFLAAMAPSGLILRIPRQLDLPGPFALAPNTSAFTIEEHSSLNDGSGEIEVEFVMVPVLGAEAGPDAGGAA